MWSSSVPEVIILDKEASRDRNPHKAKGSGCYWIMGRSCLGSSITYRIRHCYSQLGCLKQTVWGSFLPPKQAVVPSKTLETSLGKDQRNLEGPSSGLELFKPCHVLQVGFPGDTKGFRDTKPIDL